MVPDMFSGDGESDGVTFGRKRRKRAILSASQNTIPSTIKCLQCNRSFRRVGDMRRHKCDCAGGGESPERCAQSLS